MNFQIKRADMSDFEIYEEDEVKVLTLYTGHEKKVIVPAGITEIDNFDGDFVFNSNPEIEEVVLPEGLEYIGAQAFCECENLKSVTLPSTVCEIADEAFAGCKNLEKINLPKNLDTIGAGAFAGCEKLKISSIPTAVEDIQITSFENTTELLLTNPNYVELGDLMYNSQTKSVLYALDADSEDDEEDEHYLENVVLPLDAEIIGRNALSFGRFEKINLPKTVYYIGTGAFMFCENLKKIVIPANIEVIDSGAFINCKNLEEVIFEGNKPVTIESMAFNGCEKLKSIKLPKDSDYDENAFDESVEISEK